jgi:hypothetical protein
MRTEITQDNKLLIRIDEQDNEVARKSVFAQHWSKIKERFSNKYLLGFIGTVVVLIIVYISLNLSYFTISNVKVVSAGETSVFLYADEKQIKKSANMLIGQNYFKVNVEEVLTKIVASDTFISHGFFEKEFPNTIVIRLYEREPMFLYQVNNTYCALVDKNTYVLIAENDLEKCVTYSAKYPVPKVSILDSKVEYKVGTNSNTFVTDNLLKMFDTFKYFNFSVSSVKIANNVCEVITSEGKQFLFSLDSDFEEQLIRFRIAMGEIIEKKMEYTVLDVRYERPVIKN